MRCQHSFRDNSQCINLATQPFWFCDSHANYYACPFTTENGNICRQPISDKTFCQRHDTFLKRNTWQHYRKKHQIKAKFFTCYTCDDPDKIKLEMTGRCTFLVSECIYPDDAFQLKLLKLFNMYFILDFEKKCSL